MSASSITGEKPKAVVTLNIEGAEKTGSAWGDGAVDASYKAVEAIAPSESTLLLYSVNNITTGTDAKGEVSVRLEKDGRIVNVRAEGLGGRAVASGGPWRIETDWWGEIPCRRDYYDVQLSDGGVYRLYFEIGASRDPTASRWFIDGYYD